VAVASIGVAIGIYFAGYTKTDAATLTTYFPARQATTFYIDVGAMRSSGILEKLVGTTVGEEQEYRDFVQGSGFDYKADLNQVMLSSAGGVHYFVLEGRFEWNKLKPTRSNRAGPAKGTTATSRAVPPSELSLSTGCEKT
jgi:hypothetical protein